MRQIESHQETKTQESTDLKIVINLKQLIERLAGQQNSSIKTTQNSQSARQTNNLSQKTKNIKKCSIRKQNKTCKHHHVNGKVLENQESECLPKLELLKSSSVTSRDTDVSMEDNTYSNDTSSSQYCGSFSDEIMQNMDKQNSKSTDQDVSNFSNKNEVLSLSLLTLK